MMGYLEGKIAYVSVLEGIACIIANGVGYTLNIGGRLAQNVHTEEFASFFVETIVKEDSISLYGFTTFEKKLWFNSLLKVSGVGAKVAMLVIESFSSTEIANAIVSGQAKVFQSISGLGEKVSQRIVAELQKEVQKNTKLLSASKLISIEDNFKNSSIQNISIDKNSEAEPLKKTKKMQSKKQDGINVNDVTSALCNLGFDFNRSFQIANTVCQNTENLEDAIKKALAEITNG